jgi:hypothetical protein
MNFLDSIDFSDTSALDGILFTKGDKVSYTIISVTEDDKAIKVKTVLTNTRFEGKDYTIRLSLAPNAPSRRQLLQFLTAYFSIDDLRAKKAVLGDLIGKSGTLVAGDVREYNGRKYQNLQEFKAIANTPSSTTTNTLEEFTT